jgi:hypothetical protein
MAWLDPDRDRGDAMADIEIRIDDPQETWEALYARIEASVERSEEPDASSDVRSGTAGTAGAEADAFLLGMWGFL